MLHDKLLESVNFSRMTAGQQWKFKRNCVIYGSHKNGFSQRLLGEVFALPHSRIAAIIKEYRQFDPEFQG